MFCFQANQIELHKRNENLFKSEPLTIETGQHSGQLVIGDEIVPVENFIIDQSTDVVYLVTDNDSKYLHYIGKFPLTIYSL